MCQLTKGVSGVAGDLLGSQVRVLVFGTFLTLLCKPMFALLSSVYGVFGVTVTGEGTLRRLAAHRMAVLLTAPWRTAAAAAQRACIPHWQQRMRHPEVRWRMHLLTAADEQWHARQAGMPALPTPRPPNRDRAASSTPLTKSPAQ